jgi:hypothetical protein
VTSAPTPAATATTMAPTPTQIPTMYGSAARKPNRIPVAHSSTLFGPGVTAATNE